MGRAAQAGLAEWQVSSSQRERVLKFHFAEALEGCEGREFPSDLETEPRPLLLPTLPFLWEDFGIFWHSAFTVDQDEKEFSY